MIDANARCRSFQRLPLFGGQRIKRGLQFAARQFQFGHRRHVQAVETVAVLHHCGIAARLDVGEDGDDGALDAVVLRGFKGEQCIEAGVEIGVRRTEAFDGDHAYSCIAAAMASMMGCSVSRLTLSEA